MKPARLTVLVIDDNVDSAVTLADVLRIFGYTVHTAIGGMEGLARARECSPSVVICDLAMPQLDGFEVCRALASDEALRQVKRIAISGYGDEDHRQRARDVGFHHYLTKPASALELVSLIADARR